MKITWMPKSSAGKRSVMMMILNWILFIVGSVLPWKPGFSGFEFVARNPLQAVITVLMLAFGIAAVSMSVISLIKNKERSVLVFLAVAAGFYGILGFIGSVINLFFR